MDEFVNRMDKQREVLEIINTRFKCKEELCGLSKKAIERWQRANSIAPNSEVSSILLRISEKLYFLACKSQEQISSDYKIVSAEISNMQNELAHVLV
jgi:hypothetical protein